MKSSDTKTMWEHRQAELWDRVFQVTQDIVTLVESLEGSASREVIWRELTLTATAVGTHLVRANAADSAREFIESIREARLKAIETDYWLRLVHVLQQDDAVQRDLSSLITQYSAVITLLQHFVHDAKDAPKVLANRT